MYEPTVFLLAEETFDSSIAAQPELLLFPNCQLFHRHCFACDRLMLATRTG